MSSNRLLGSSPTVPPATHGFRQPYEFQPCAHHVDPEESGYPECPDGEYPTPECRETCSESTFSSGYETDKKLAREAYSLGVSALPSSFRGN